jgi:hypothetical protein
VGGGLYFGAEKTLGAGTFFSGLIDDVRIYSAALSAEEVAPYSPQTAQHIQRAGSFGELPAFFVQK